MISDISVDLKHTGCRFNTNPQSAQYKTLCTQRKTMRCDAANGTLFVKRTQNGVASRRTKSPSIFNSTHVGAHSQRSNDEQQERYKDLGNDSRGSAESRWHDLHESSDWDPDLHNLQAVKEMIFKFPPFTNRRRTYCTSEAMYARNRAK